MRTSRPPRTTRRDRGDSRRGDGARPRRRPARLPQVSAPATRRYRRGGEQIAVRGRLPSRHRRPGDRRAHTHRGAVSDPGATSPDIRTPVVGVARCVGSSLALRRLRRRPVRERGAVLRRDRRRTRPCSPTPNCVYSRRHRSRCSTCTARSASSPRWRSRSEWNQLVSDLRDREHRRPRRPGVRAGRDHRRLCQSEKSAAAVDDWLLANCAVDIGPVFTIVPAGTGDHHAATARWRRTPRRRRRRFRDRPDQAISPRRRMTVSTRP